MKDDIIPRPASEAEVSSISQTLTVAQADTSAVLERLACAAAMIEALPEPPQQPCLVHEPGEGLPPAVILIGDELEVGRQVPGAGCISDCSPLSRRHFAVRRYLNSFVVEDLGSTNGTMIDGVAEPIGRRVLRDGDFILAGAKFFLFVNPEQ